VDIWDRACLLSAVFGLIQICHRARYRAAGGFVHFVDSTHVDGLAIIWLHFLHQVAIAIVDELGGLTSQCDRDQVLCTNYLSLRKK
jgi:hypothetical protein